MRALAVQYAASRYCPPLRQYSEPPGTSRTRDACVFPDNPVSRASAVPASHRVPATQPGAVTDVRAPGREAVVVPEDPITVSVGPLDRRPGADRVSARRGQRGPAGHSFGRSVPWHCRPERLNRRWTSSRSLPWSWSSATCHCSPPMSRASRRGFANVPGTVPSQCSALGLRPNRPAWHPHISTEFSRGPVGYGDLAQALRHVCRRRPDWLDRQRERIRRRGEWLRAESERYRRDAEVQRLDAQATIAKADKLAVLLGCVDQPVPDTGRPSNPSALSPGTPGRLRAFRRPPQPLGRLSGPVRRLRPPNAPPTY